MSKRSKPPPTVKVGPHTWAIDTGEKCRRHLAAAGKFGHCDESTLTIALDASSPHTVAADTLLHELTHAMVRPAALEKDTEELVAEILGPALLGVLRENPELVEWLTA